ncbi:MAG: CHAD domain-containing protein [Gammaproteobacteria bacterium]
MALKPAKVHAQQSVGEALRALLLKQLEALAANEDAARAPTNPEGVHQMRVALRRMRSALRLFRPALSRALEQRWAEDLRWIAARLGAARDLDVFIHDSLEPTAGCLPLPGHAALGALAERRRRRAYRTVNQLLGSARYARFKQNFRAWLTASGGWAGVLPVKRRARLQENIMPFARQCLTRQARKIATMGARLDRDSQPALHALRIQCKRLRYAAEFFAPLFQGMDDFIDHLKALQDQLGVMNDTAVMRHLLDDLLAGRKNPALERYASALIGWRAHHYYAARDRFDECWRQFAAARQPWRARLAVVKRKPISAEH